MAEDHGSPWRDDPRLKVSCSSSTRPWRPRPCARADLVKVRSKEQSRSSTTLFYKELISPSLEKKNAACGPGGEVASSGRCGHSGDGGERRRRRRVRASRDSRVHTADAPGGRAPGRGGAAGSWSPERRPRRTEAADEPAAWRRRFRRRCGLPARSGGGGDRGGDGEASVGGDWSGNGCGSGDARRVRTGRERGEELCCVGRFARRTLVFLEIAFQPFAGVFLQNAAMEATWLHLIG